MRYFILFLIVNISLYGLEEPSSKKQKLSHKLSAPAAAAAAASSSSSYVYPAVANAQAYAAAAAASSYSPSFSSAEIPLHAKLSNIIEVSNSQITFPTDLSQVIIDKVKPNRFEEIGTLVNVSEIFSIAWSPNGDYLASSGRSPDISVKIWSATTGK
ncbi:MAG: hypothetical protein P4L22_02305, partial [Candidatus Babeliales bacterium]|nr:hypothetical protein [Candidatus Babeliales bacterium]